MKVLFLSSWYPTNSNPNFGIFIKEHAHAIHTSGNEIVVLSVVIQKSDTFFKRLITNYIDENGINTICIQLQSRFYDILYHAIPLQYFFLRKTAFQLFKSGFIPEIIHSNVVFPAGIMGYWLSASLHCPHVITEHWSRLPRFMKKPVLSRWVQNAYSSANLILPVSLFLQKRIQGVIPSLPDDKFKIIGNVVDSKCFNFKVKRESDDCDIVKFCAIATWNHKKIPDKIPELFIMALSKLQNQLTKKIELTMIGGGDKIDYLKKMCSNENLNVVFTGYLPKNKIADYLQQSDFFLHASTIETFSIVTVEALLCGLPVVCSNVGALPGLINNTNGVLCENTYESWMRGILTVMQENYDRSLISKNISERFSSEKIGRQISELYSTISK